ncbi:MAG: ABC transporter permease [Candidatus Thorarchaeota archaeon]|jgi:thiamine transport system permease protein
MRKRPLAFYGAISIPFLVLMVFLIYPVLRVLIEGILLDTGSSVAEVLESPVTQRAFIFSIYQAFLSTILSVILGLSGAILLTRLRFRGKKLVKSLLIVPFVLPPIVVVVGFIRMFGPFGIIDSIAMALTGSIETLIDLASGIPGIILAHAFYNVPLVILMVSSSLERLDPDIEESAELLGASSLQKFRRVTLPHILPSLLASSLLTFIFCFMSFPIVLTLGEGRYKTLEVQIYDAFRAFDFTKASTVGILQILVTMALAFTYIQANRRQNVGAGPTSSIKTRSFSQLNSVTRVLAIFYFTILCVLVVGPIASILQSAIYDPVTSTYTLDGFTNLLRIGTGGGFVPLINSVLYAVLATILAVILGIPLAYSRRSKGKILPNFTSMLVLLPLGISAITVAYGLMIAIAVPLGLTTNPWPIIVIAQTIIGLPFSAKSIEVSLDKIDNAILENADILGVSRIQRLMFLELPLLMPGIVVGAVFAFAMAIGEMSATLFIALPQNFTLAVAIYQNLIVRKFVEAGAASLVLVAICVISFIIIEHLSEESIGGAV